MDIVSIISGFFIFTGVFFIIVASIGVVRFPDFYSRIHPAGKCDTMGQAMVLIGLIIFELFTEGFNLISVKMFIIIAFIFIVNPTATHALANSALIMGLKPWTKDGKSEEYPSSEERQK